MRHTGAHTNPYPTKIKVRSSGPSLSGPSGGAGPFKITKTPSTLCRAVRYALRLYVFMVPLVGSGSYTLTANACAYHHLAAREPNVLAPLGPTHLGPPPRRTLRPPSPRQESRDRRRRSPCSCCAADRARKYCRRRNPCSTCAPGRARRCCRRRSPCTGCAAARARRCHCRRSPCRCCAAARARRGRCRRTPCSPCAAARAPCSQMLMPPHSLPDSGHSSAPNRRLGGLSLPDLLRALYYLPLTINQRGRNGSSKRLF